MKSTAKHLVRMLDELGRVSDDHDGLTRTFLSPAMRRANALVGQWMRDAGLSVREDSVGNLIGRLESGQNDRPKRQPAAKTLLLGSHLDTVRNAGRFDGALGVLAPIAALTELRRRGIALPFAVEVLGFSEEEGVRFASAYLGSKGYTGRLRAADLNLRDADGISVGEALAKLNRGRFFLPRPAHRRSDLLGYCEVHIEQGPVLEAEKLAVSTVTAIAGQTRGRLTLRGRAGHAGTTPMHLRRDALVGAAEFISFVEAHACQHPPLVATVGTLNIPGGAPNVIPGEVVLSLDVRHPRDAARESAVRGLLQQANAIAKARGLTVHWQITQDNAAANCSMELTKVLAQSVSAIQGHYTMLVSGAGHDAVVMSAATPIAMLFMRCRGGLSHHPDEYASPKDLGVAVEVLIDFLQRVARNNP
jgi:allantoate deiminase